MKVTHILGFLSSLGTSTASVWLLCYDPSYSSNQGAHIAVRTELYPETDDLHEECGIQANRLFNLWVYHPRPSVPMPLPSIFVEDDYLGSITAPFDVTNDVLIIKYGADGLYSSWNGLESDSVNVPVLKVPKDPVSEVEGHMVVANFLLCSDPEYGGFDDSGNKKGGLVAVPSPIIYQDTDVDEMALLCKSWLNGGFVPYVQDSFLRGLSIYAAEHHPPTTSIQSVRLYTRKVIDNKRAWGETLLSVVEQTVQLLKPKEYPTAGLQARKLQGVDSVEVGPEAQQNPLR